METYLKCSNLPVVMDQQTIISFKGDLHLHTNEDPVDNKIIRHNHFELVDHLDNLNFDFFSITLHNHIMDNDKQEEVKDYSKSKGMIYFDNGVEKTIQKGHHLIYGLDQNDLEKITDYETLEQIHRQYQLKNKILLLGVSHPHFPSSSCMNKKLGQNHRLFHFVEYNSFYINLINFNNRLRPKSGRFYPIKTIIGNSDAHDLERIGNTYTILHVPNSYFEFKSSNPSDNLSSYINPNSKEEFKSMVKNCSIEEYEKIKNVLIKTIIKEDPYDPKYVQVVTKPLDYGYLIKSLFNMFIKKH
jgi:signal recognition particle subunit SEC65